MPHIDPTPFITITPRGHRPRLGAKLARVPLGGARVAPATAAKLAAWMAQIGKSRGITLDLLVTFADENGFNDFATGYTCRKILTQIGAATNQHPSDRPATTQKKSITMPSPAYIAFDIETRPLPDLVDKYARPFPDFDESAVKYGNTKDPLKRAALLEQKRIDHQEDCLAYWAKLRERAALDPFTGAIVCIGVITDTGAPEIIAEATEAATLRQWWQIYSLTDNATSKFVFWSGCGDAAKKFDIDYIVTRSRINRVPLPSRVRDGRYYDRRIVDLAGEFLLNQRDRYLSLTKAADMLGLYAEHADIFPKTDTDPVRGENFWLWWQGAAAHDSVPETQSSPAEQRALAVKYLCNDLLTTKYLAPHILS